MKCGTKKYAKGGMVKKYADGGAVMPPRFGNFQPQGQPQAMGAERASFMRGDETRGRPDFASRGRPDFAARRGEDFRNRRFDLGTPDRVAKAETEKVIAKKPPNPNPLPGSARPGPAPALMGSPPAPAPATQTQLAAAAAPTAPIGYDIAGGQEVPWGMGDRRFQDNLPPFKKGGLVKKMAGGGAVMPAQAAAGLQRAAAKAPALPSQAVAARPFKKGGMVKKMAKGGMTVKPRGASGRGVKACKVC